MPDSTSPTKLILPRIRSMHAYVPGSQSNDPDIIKLNTNENPFPASPLVRRHLMEELDAEQLQRYPNPTSAPLRTALARKHGRESANILVGNGSDEVLSILFRGVLEEGSRLAFPDPSYSLYPVIAAIIGAECRPTPVKANWQVDFEALKKQDAPLTVITHPNAPTGLAENKMELLNFVKANPALTLVDEAYVEFGGESLASLAGTDEYPRLLTCNTFSKAYSLAGQRVGWLVAHKDIIFELDKIRDSYNLSRLAQTAALAALEEESLIQERIVGIVDTRDKLAAELEELGFQSLKSATNFIFTRPPLKSKSGAELNAEKYFKFLESKKIIIRYFSAAHLSEFVRISIGKPEDMDKLIQATKEFLA